MDRAVKLPMIVSYNVPPDSVRRIPNPNGVGEAYYVLCPVEALALGPDLPWERTNPREQKLTTDVAKAISESLRSRDGRFHLLNRGITLSAYEASFETHKGQFSFHLVDPDTHGIIDGGHTYRIIKRDVQERHEEWKSNVIGIDEPQQQYVRLEILTSVDHDLIIDLADARNTSTPVTETTLADLNKELDWLKQELDDYRDVIAYKQFERKDVDARTIIALLTLFNRRFDDRHHPIQAYTSKAKCLEYFRDKEMQDSYKELRPVIHDILCLYDYVRYTMRELYNEEGGSFKRLKAVRGKDKKPNVGSTKLLFWKGLNGQTDELEGVVIHDALVYPMLASLRFLLKQDERNSSIVKWKVNSILAFWDRFGGDLIKTTIATCRSLGNNLNATGKNGVLWQQLYDKVKSAYYELRTDLNADKDVMVTSASPAEQKQGAVPEADADDRRGA